MGLPRAVLAAVEPDDHDRLTVDYPLPERVQIGAGAAGGGVTIQFLAAVENTFTVRLVPAATDDPGR